MCFLLTILQNRHKTLFDIIKFTFPKLLFTFSSYGVCVICLMKMQLLIVSLLKKDANLNSFPLDYISKTYWKKTQKWSIISSFERFANNHIV